MYDIIAILIPIVLAICIVYAIRIVTDHRLRRYLAEMETDQETVKVLLETDQKNREASVIRWGTLTTSIGLAMLIIQIFGLSANDPLAYGLILLGMGVGLLFSRSLKK